MARDVGMTMMRTRKRVLRTRDPDGRDRTNEGTTMAWTRTRGKGQRTKRVTMTRGRPHIQDDLSTPLHHCQPLLTGWIAGGQQQEAQ